MCVLPHVDCGCALPNVCLNVCCFMCIVNMCCDGEWRGSRSEGRESDLILFDSLFLLCLFCFAVGPGLVCSMLCLKWFDLGG